MPRVCAGCGRPFCYACGESVTPNPNADEQDCLFHCANLQGAILGVGLAMLEQSFLDETVATPDEANKSKRRKVSGNSTPLQNDLEDEDEAYFALTLQAHGGPVGKKAKTGIGYAGTQKEDVGLVHCNVTMHN